MSITKVVRTRTFEDPQTAEEIAAGITPTNTSYEPGDVRRYGALLDGSTNDTTAFNNAIASGHPAYCPGGTANIQGTIVIKSEQSLKCEVDTVLQRFDGASTDPMLHIYGNRSVFDGGHCTIRQNLYDHPKGIILIGHDPDDTTPGGGGTNVQCYFQNVKNFKLVGPENTGPNAPILNKSPGVFCNSNRRKGAGTYPNPCYKSNFENWDIVNCDIALGLSTEFSSHSFRGLYIHQWRWAAIFMCGAYGNTFDGLMMEAVLDDTPTTRHAIHFEEANKTIETGTDVTWLIQGAFRNRINGYTELPASGNAYVSAYTPGETWDGEGGTYPANAGLYGDNEVRLCGTVSGGIGKDGSSAGTAMGLNSFDGSAVFKTGGQQGGGSHKIFSWGGYEIRKLDDLSGHISVAESFFDARGRLANIAEATQKDVLELDGIGNNSAGAMIELDYVAHWDADSGMQCGKVIWGIFQETTGSRQYKKLYEIAYSADEANAITPNCTIAAGAVSNETKATIGFLTGNPAGTNEFFIAWKIQGATSVKPYDVSDYDADIKLNTA